MASPVAALAGSGVASVGGSVISALGGLSQGQSQSNLYNYQAGVALQNANLKKQDANYAFATGGVEEQETGLRARAQVGATKAGFGAGNISTTSGSADKVIGSEIKIGQQNEGIVSANAAKRAYGFEVGAAMDQAQAGVDYAAAKYSKEAGTLGAISSIIGGAGSVSSKWLQASQSFGSGEEGGNSGEGGSMVNNYVG